MTNTAMTRAQARRAALSKAAEATAYAEGFCRAAEAMGVDPGQLCKQASKWGLLGLPFRVGGLLFGGKSGRMARQLGRLDRTAGRVTDKLTAAGAAGDRAAAMRHSGMLDRINAHRDVLARQHALERGKVGITRGAAMLGGGYMLGRGGVGDYLPYDLQPGNGR